MVVTPAAIPEMGLQAFKEAQTERPGATYLGIPEDMETFFDVDDLLPPSPYDEVDTEPASNQMKRTAEVLQAEKKTLGDREICIRE